MSETKGAVRQGCSERRFEVSRSGESVTYRSSANSVLLSNQDGGVQIVAGGGSASEAVWIHIEESSDTVSHQVSIAAAKSPVSAGATLAATRMVISPEALAKERA